MAGKSLVETGVDVTSRFEQELQSRADDLYREAALAMLTKLHPSNKVTVEEFLSALEQHKDVWSAVSRMGVIEFAMALGGRGGATEDESEESVSSGSAQGKRTRLSESQKNSLKGIVISILGGARDGYSRTDLAAQISNDLLSTVGVVREELADKLRQPLHELVAENKIHTVGEKRLMRYHNGAKRS
jgi:hypothetical protein